MENLAIKFLSKCRRCANYRGYNTPLGIVEKVFNCGHGSLALFGFKEDVDEKTIIINSTLATERDRERLNKFIKEEKLQDWVIREKEYGYPEYYKHNFMTL